MALPPDRRICPCLPSIVPKSTTRMTTRSTVATGARQPLRLPQVERLRARRLWSPEGAAVRSSRCATSGRPHDSARHRRALPRDGEVATNVARAPEITVKQASSRGGEEDHRRDQGPSEGRAAVNGDSCASTEKRDDLQTAMALLLKSAFAIRCSSTTSAPEAARSARRLRATRARRPSAIDSRPAWRRRADDLVALGGDHASSSILRRSLPLCARPGSRRVYMPGSSWHHSASSWRYSRDAMSPTSAVQTEQ